MIASGVRLVEPPLIQKIEVVTYCLLKPEHSNKQAYITFLVRHGPQISTPLVSVLLFLSLCHLCEPGI